MSRFRRKSSKDSIDANVILWKFDPRKGFNPLLIVPEKNNNKERIDEISIKVRSFMGIIQTEKVFSHKWTILPLLNETLALFYAFFMDYWYIITLDASDSTNLVIFTEEILPELDNLINLYFLVTPEKKWNTKYLEKIYTRYKDFKIDNSSDNIDKLSSGSEIVNETKNQKTTDLKSQELVRQ